MNNPTIVRFKADTDEYNKKVKQAKDQLTSFGQGGKQAGAMLSQFDNVMGTSIGTIGKLSLGIGAVTAALSVAKDAFIDCEANAESFQRMTEQAKSGYESFCATLRNGDWGNFLDDMRSAIDAAKELYNTLDELGTFQLATSVDFAKIDRDRAKNKLDLKKGDISQAEYDKREKALSKKENELIKREKNLLSNSAMKSLISGAADNGIAKGDIMKYFNGDFGIKTVDDASRKLKEAQDKVKSLKAERKAYTKKNGTYAYDAVLFNMSQRISAAEKEVPAISYLANPDNFAKATQAYQLQQQAYQRETQVLRNQTKGYKDTTTKAPKGKPRDTSIKVDPASLGLTGLGMEGVDTGDGKLPAIKVPVEAAIDYQSMIKAQEELDELQAAADAEKLFGAWSDAANGISAVGSALSSIDDPAAKVLGIIAEAIATIALTFAKSLKTTFGPWDWIAAAATGTATMIGTITAIKSATAEYHANGGFVGQGIKRGTDVVPAMLTPGELVLNKAQQVNVAEGLRQNSLSNLHLETRVRNEDMVICLNAGSVRRGRGEYLTSKSR